MFTLKSTLFFLVFLSLTVALRAHANESEEAPHEPTESHDTSANSETKGSLPAWVYLENKVTELKSRIESKNKGIMEMLQDKKKYADNSPELKKLTDDIVKEHKEVQKLQEEYNKKAMELKYRYPERNAKGARVYNRIEVKSIEEMEQAVGIDGKLNRSLKRMRSQFKSDEKNSTVESQNSAQNEKSKKAQPKAPSIEEAGAIVIQK